MRQTAGSWLDYHESDKDKTGFWYIFWYDKQSRRVRRRSTGASDRAAAEIAHAQMILEDARQDREEAASTLLCSHALEDYLREHVDSDTRPGRKVTSKATQHQCARHLSAHFGMTPINAVDREQVREYVRVRAEGGIGRPAGDGTLRRELGVLIAAINHEVVEKRLRKVDVPIIELPESPPPRDRWLTEDECERLLQASGQPMGRDAKGRLVRMEADGSLPRAYRFVLLALETAARKEALEKLTWAQVDLDRRIIKLNPEGRTQTAKRRPTLPISDRLHEMLVRAKAEAKTAYVLDAPGSIRSAFESAVIRSGLEDVSPHVLRHTWATQAAQAGVNMTDIADVLGDDVRTVERNYRHHCPTHLRGAINFRRKSA
jgi:integrase